MRWRIFRVSESLAEWRGPALGDGRVDADGSEVRSVLSPSFSLQLVMVASRKSVSSFLCSLELRFPTGITELFLAVIDPLQRYSLKVRAVSDIAVLHEVCTSCILEMSNLARFYTSFDKEHTARSGL